MPYSSAPIAFGPIARSAIASDRRRGAFVHPSLRLPSALHSSAPQRAQGGDDEGDRVCERNLPEQPSRPMPCEQDVTLVDGRQERSYRECNHSGPSERRGVADSARDARAHDPARRLELKYCPLAQPLAAAGAGPEVCGLTHPTLPGGIETLG